MNLQEYLAKKGFRLVKEENVERVVLDDYEIIIVNDKEVMLPIPLPTGKESLDDLISMGVKYARASRLSQQMGSPLEYKIEGSVVYVIKKFNSREDLENSLMKALEGIESLRYFL
ncbi:MAG: hypothetical protein OWQ54_04600 [Sulfolobaceae archaeon]|nr:hypothetical protein [Sulfolobaceae archaeon]